MCGEHLINGVNGDGYRGSSPRVRGTLYCRRSQLRRFWDHPRVCGEHVFIVKRGHGIRGSSPRVRGTRRVWRNMAYRYGIIPACAGNTSWCSRSSPDARDHPRVCGEHKLVLTELAGRTGSSPRVRGTRMSIPLWTTEHGIIPACAGNTTSRPSNEPSTRDHPRVCGEHQKGSAWCSPRLGSSPRVRGTPKR